MTAGKAFAGAFKAAIVATLVAAATPALADSRLVSHEYDADEVVRIDGKLGVQATVAFAKNESIENIAVGDSQKWQITPNKRANLLFVKPLQPGARTNMTVVTDKRTYFFDLVATARAKPLYMLKFTYADEVEDGDAATPETAPPGGLAALNVVERETLSGDPMAKPADPAELNFAWARKGDNKLLPSKIYDDGNATYLLWDAKRAVPAILVLNAEGVEGPVNYVVRGTTIVIDDVPATIVLRSGKASATLKNLNGSVAKDMQAGVNLWRTFEKVHPSFKPRWALARHSSTDRHFSSWSN